MDAHLVHSRFDANAFTRSNFLALRENMQSVIRRIRGYSTITQFGLSHLAFLTFPVLLFSSFDRFGTAPVHPKGARSKRSPGEAAVASRSNAPNKSLQVSAG